MDCRKTVALALGLLGGLGGCRSQQVGSGPPGAVAQSGNLVAVELEPDDRRYADTLAVGLAASGRWDDSLRVFARFNNEATAHYKLAGTLRRLGKPDLCRQHLELALSRDPNLAPAQALLAELQ